MINIFSAVGPNDFNVPKTQLTQGSLDTVLQIVLGLAAAIAIIMLLIGSLKYITSQGDPGAVSRAKNTILYSVIGLVIVAGAFSIVTFVVKGVS